MAAAVQPRNGARTGAIRHLALQPEMASFLAEVPRVGRMLRPLMLMLGTEPGVEFAGTTLACPPVIRRPRVVKPADPPQPTVPRAAGKYPRFNPRTYSPGRIPPFSKITSA